MAQSWFYLTLWRGTPPEMTEYVDTTVTEIAATGSVIYETTAEPSTVPLTDQFNTEVMEAVRDAIMVEERTEVTWYVGNG